MATNGRRRSRFFESAKKLGWYGDPVRGKYTSYSCRHTFVHRMLSGYWTNGVGCSIETVAELIGDTPKVAFDHYGREWGQHCRPRCGLPLANNPRRLERRSHRRSSFERRWRHDRQQERNNTTQKQTRRRAYGSAWHWQQTDGWYFTPPGTKRRVALLDSSGRRIGKSNKQAAELALARLRAKSDWKPAPGKAN